MYVKVKLWHPDKGYVQVVIDKPGVPFSLDAIREELKKLGLLEEYNVVEVRWTRTPRSGRFLTI